MAYERHQHDPAPWADEPLTDATGDELGRGPFVATVVSQISESTASDPSTVFGLVGEWGSGKTSIIQQVRSKLSDDWIVADFTPWSSGDTSAMSFEFVSTLADALGVAASGETRAKFARYAGFVAPLLNAVPLAGAAAGGVANEVLATLASRPPWHKQFEELSSTVAEVGTRVLVVIDDVDRLAGSELMNLLRVVRLLGRFRGIHYLMAYDQATIEELLEVSGSVGRATSFMEKIVQYPFEVPPISRAAALRLTHQTLSQLMEASGARLDDHGLQREAELAHVLAPMIRTPRTLGRFRSQLLAFATHVRDAELDVLDYAGVTWLRLEAHGVWSQLSRWHSELKSGTRSTGLHTSEKIPLDDWLARIRGVDPAGDPRDIARVLDLLFPGISLDEVSSHYAHPRSVADEVYFGRYLLLALPEDDVSDELIAAVVDDLVDRGESERLDELIALLDGADATANLGYKRAFEHRRDASSTSRALVEFLLERVRRRLTDPRIPGSPRTTLTPWLAREVALSVEAGQALATDVIEAVGEVDSFTVIMQFTNVLRDRDRAKSIARGFADYWLNAVRTRKDELLDDHIRLTSSIELIAWSYGVEMVEGILDNAIDSFDSYVRVASAFVRFSRWVGSDITYEMRFAQPEFAAVVSTDTRSRFLEQVKAARTGLSYQLDDLPSPDVDLSVLREFVLDSLSLDGPGRTEEAQA